MRSHPKARSPWLDLAGIAVLVLFAGAQAARPDEPMLAIRLVGDESAIYAVSEITRIDFEEDTVVVVTDGDIDSYAAEVIARIEFLWEFSRIEDPEDAAALLQAAHLFQNQPNPFSPETRIEFELPQAGCVELGIYSVSGRLIRMLVDVERAAGRQSVSWDGCDDAGRKVAGGVYFYNLAAPGIEESRQMILVP